MLYHKIKSCFFNTDIKDIIYIAMREVRLEQRGGG
jgi:hypothetical protein